jgi:four helix bundle protein
MTAQSYRDLEIYQLAHSLAVEVHIASLALPKYELYEEGSQVRRAAKSVPANIVEGFGRRRYKAEFIKYLVYAHASCDETVAHLNLLHDCRSLADDRYSELLESYLKLGRMLYRFMESVEAGHQT